MSAGKRKEHPTPEQSDAAVIRKALDQVPTWFEVSGIRRAHGKGGDATIDFSIKGLGFGQIVFYHADDGTLCCANEHMDKTTLKMILGKLVDNCDLDDK